jgi:hypothetical protein
MLLNVFQCTGGPIFKITRPKINTAEAEESWAGLREVHRSRKHSLMFATKRDTAMHMGQGHSSAGLSSEEADEEVR